LENFNAAKTTLGSTSYTQLSRQLRNIKMAELCTLLGGGGEGGGRVHAPSQVSITGRNVN